MEECLLDLSSYNPVGHPLFDWEISDAVHFFSAKLNTQVYGALNLVSYDHDLLSTTAYFLGSPKPLNKSSYITYTPDSLTLAAAMQESHQILIKNYA